MTSPRQIRTKNAPENLLLLSDGNGAVKLGTNPSSAGGFVAGGRTMFDKSAYRLAGGSQSGLIQYVQVTLVDGDIFDRMQTFIENSGLASREVRMGIYDQADPSDPMGVPRNLIAQTNSVGTGVPDGTFIDLSLVDTLVPGGSGAPQDFEVPATGFYWLAFVTDSATLRFAVTETFRANYLDRREESGTGTTLPATASGLSNPVSSVIFQAAMVKI